MPKGLITDPPEIRTHITGIWYWGDHLHCTSLFWKLSYSLKPWYEPRFSTFLKILKIFKNANEMPFLQLWKTSLWKHHLKLQKRRFFRVCCRFWKNSKSAETRFKSHFQTNFITFEKAEKWRFCRLLSILIRFQNCKNGVSLRVFRDFDDFQKAQKRGSYRVFRVFDHFQKSSKTTFLSLFQRFSEDREDFSWGQETL